MCKLKGQMDNGEHYYVEIKGLIQSGHSDVQIKRADG